jgi:hypothetical protein
LSTGGDAPPVRGPGISPRGLGLREAAAVLSFACPRCAAEVSEDYYGPCTTCRHDLRATQGSDPAGTSSETAYEPKMNVTPNAVALKE